VQSRFVRVSQKTLDELGAELFPGKGAGYRYDLSEFDAVQAEELERRLVSRHDHVENRVCRLTTRPGEEAVTKNDVECSYLTDFDVQMSAFRNDPEVVFAAAAAVVPRYRNHFKVIEFAVYCRPGDTQNFDAFKRALCRCSSKA